MKPCTTPDGLQTPPWVRGGLGGLARLQRPFGYLACPEPCARPLLASRLRGLKVSGGHHGLQRPSGEGRRCLEAQRRPRRVCRGHLMRNDRNAIFEIPTYTLLSLRPLHLIDGSREVDLCSKGLEDPRWGLGSLKPGLSFKIRCLHVLVSFAMRTHCLCSTFGLRVVFWDSACDTVVCRHLRNLLLRALIPLMSVLGVIGEAFRP